MNVETNRREPFSAIFFCTIDKEVKETKEVYRDHITLARLAFKGNRGMNTVLYRHARAQQGEVGISSLLPSLFF